MILGIGVDLVDVSLFRGLISDPTSAFKKWHFTDKEREYCEGQKGHDPVRHYAGRYAAKEALIKAVGAFYKRKDPDITDFNYLEMEVITSSISGLEVKVGGRLKEVLEKFGTFHIWVSLSHETNVAVAMVVLEKE